MATSLAVSLFLGLEEENWKMKKKCGILTLHRALNYGAFLQAFALQETVKRLGYNVSIIDLAKNKTVERLLLIKCKYPKMVVHHYKLLKKFDEVATQLEIRSDSLDKYDAVIVGSDELWNLKNGMFKHYPEYLAKSNEKASFISYAVSANSLTPQEFVELQGQNEDFSGFKAVSVRDTKTFNIVKTLGKIEPAMVLDPTLIMDSWEPYVKQCKEKNFILYYSMTVDSKERTAVEQFAKQTGKKLITVGCRNEWCDQMVYANPFEFIGYVKAADYVVTSQFHGIMFSLVFNKELAIFSQGKGKVIDAIDRFGLEDREVTETRALFDILAKDMDYDRINTDIRKKRKLSVEWLDNALRIACDSKE